MKCALSLVVAVLLPLARGWAQGETPSPVPDAVANVSPGNSAITPAPAAEVSPAHGAPAKRSLFSRMLHPLSSGSHADTPTRYKDPRLRGLLMTLQISPQPAKLSEVRLLDIKATLTNKGKKAVELDFVTDQRIEIHLMNSADVVLTKWSDNHAVANKPANVLINPEEHLEYNEKISTRELPPDKVFVAEVFFPQFPELRVRQKFMTAP